MILVSHGCIFDTLGNYFSSKKMGVFNDYCAMTYGMRSGHHGWKQFGRGDSFYGEFIKDL